MSSSMACRYYGSFKAIGIHAGGAPYLDQGGNPDCDGASIPTLVTHGALAAEADVTDREHVARAVERARTELGGLDVYFNNAGIPEVVKPLAEITREEWDAVLDVNLTALFLAAQVAAPKLRGGTLLVTASIIAHRPRPGLAAYVASKAGVIGLARALAVELAPDVRVNVINPGPANTPMLGGFGFDSDVAQALPLKRLIEPEDIAGAAVYLASDDARAITGAVFNVDGGRDL
jgi:3-oxoacyl-[acyl-carrier protein] reductase